jgi:hypothetical protein
MSFDYGRIFGTKVMLSTDLQNKETYNKLVSDGYIWIKQKHVDQFHRLVRFPTVGRWIELSRTGAGHFVAIDSTKGKKLINNLCYYI